MTTPDPAEALLAEALAEARRSPERLAYQHRYIGLHQDATPRDVAKAAAATTPGAALLDAARLGLALGGWHTVPNRHPNTDGSPWGWVADSKGREVIGTTDKRLTWSGRREQELLDRVFAAARAIGGQP